MSAAGVARGAAAHVFVDDLDSPTLCEEDAHHLARVLRLRAGELVTAGDGAGRIVPCEWSAPGLRPTGEVVVAPRPSPPLCIAFAITKGGKPEIVVQRLTELGIDRIVPFRAARSVVRWEDDRLARNAERLRRVAREAAMQSRRAWLPEVAEPTSFDAAIEAADTAVAALAEPGGEPLTSGVATVFVGPEGGWSEAELGALDRRVALAEDVLRAETAAIVAGALLSALRADLVQVNAKSGLSGPGL